MKTIKSKEIKPLRRKLGINQSDFWSLVGVTQSGGSRYETGRPMPPPLKIVFNIAYGDRSALKPLLRGRK